MVYPVLSWPSGPLLSRKKPKGLKKIKDVRGGSDRDFRLAKEQKLLLKTKGSEVTRSRFRDLAAPEDKHTYVG